MFAESHFRIHEGITRSFLLLKTPDERETGMAKGRENLEWLLDYELRCAERYRRYVSVVMMAAEGQSGAQLLQLLNDQVRKSDEVFDLEYGTAILMGETDLPDSLRAIQRFRGYCEGNVELKCAIASYPEDRGSARDMVAALYRRIQTAAKGENGTIVTNG